MQFQFRGFKAHSIKQNKSVVTENSNMIMIEAVLLGHG